MGVRVGQCCCPACASFASSRYCRGCGCDMSSSLGNHMGSVSGGLNKNMGYCLGKYVGCVPSVGMGLCSAHTFHSPKISVRRLEANKELPLRYLRPRSIAKFGSRIYSCNAKINCTNRKGVASRGSCPLSIFTHKPRASWRGSKRFGHLVPVGHWFCHSFNTQLYNNLLALYGDGECGSGG